MMRKIVLLITVLILITSLIFSYYSYSKIKVSNRYANSFSKSLIQVVNEQKEFHMADVTEFNWDRMIVFGPYTPREHMEEKVGQRWTTHSYAGYYLIQKTILGEHPLDDDSYNKVIFINGDKIMLDVTFNRGQVDLTKLHSQVINRDDATFYIQDKVLKQKLE